MPEKIQDDLTKAQNLLFLANQGIELSVEEKLFVNKFIGGAFPEVEESIQKDDEADKANEIRLVQWIKRRDNES